MKPTPILVRTNGYPFQTVSWEILFHWHESFVSSTKQIFHWRKVIFSSWKQIKHSHFRLVKAGLSTKRSRSIEQSPGWIGIGHVWGIKYQSASLRISPTVGCGKTMDFSSEAFMPFSTAIPAMTISSEAGFPKGGRR